ncbi:hypothetical protein CF319_g594 [Tilletia indica]|nr:hypothetical protein CF319_g594 [Tilletia indica]
MVGTAAGAKAMAVACCRTGRRRLLNDVGPPSASCDSLFLALAPAWARHRPFSTSTTQHRQQDYQDRQTSDFVDLRRPAFKRSQMPSSSRSSSEHSSKWWSPSPLSPPRDPESGRYIVMETKKLNNYFLALARVYRTPPPAYVCEAIRLLRDVCLAQFKGAQQRYSRANTGPDRMTFEIILDMLARAIPLHTDLNRELSKEKQKRGTSDTSLPQTGAASSDDRDLPSSAEHLDPEKAVPLHFGTSKRVPSFYEYALYPPNLEYDTPPHHHLAPRNLIGTLNDFLRSSHHGSLQSKFYFFPQDDQTIQNVSDADDLFFHPTPSRASRNRRAASGRGNDSEAGSDGQVDARVHIPGGLDRADRSRPPKTAAQVYLALFGLVYRALLSRYPDKPYQPYASDPDDWHAAGPQFVMHPGARKRLVSSGIMGPGGPSVFSYASRIMCFQRVRDWDEVRATVRECLTRAYWNPPLIQARSRGEGRVGQNGEGPLQYPVQRKVRTQLPDGWTGPEVDALFEETHNNERSMFNGVLLSQVIWAWVRVQAPSAPYTVPVEDWVESDDEPNAPRILGPGRDQGQDDISLPPASDMGNQKEAQEAVAETVRQLRDVYELLRDNAMLQEWERMNRTESEGTEAEVGDVEGGELHGPEWVDLSIPFVEPERQEWNTGSRMDRELAYIRRKGRWKKWSKNKMWLQQMRALVRRDAERMDLARYRKVKALRRGEIRTVAEEDIIDLDDDDGADDDKEKKGGGGAGGKVIVSATPPRKKRVLSRHERTLRSIFGIPSHPALRPQLPPHIVPDGILYTQFIRIYSQLGDWKEAVEVLADYEQTPIQWEEHVPANEEEVGRADEPSSRRKRVMNEATLPIFEAFFRAYSMHGMPPIPNSPINVVTELNRLQAKVSTVLHELGLEDERKPAEVLDVSELLSHVSPEGQGWTLESLMFMFEAFLRLRPDCGTGSVERRRKAREEAYQRDLAARRKAMQREREEAGGVGVEEEEEGEELVRAYQFEGASPTPPMSQQDQQTRREAREFFDTNLPQSSQGLRPHSEEELDRPFWEPKDSEWVGPIGQPLLDRIFGPAGGSEEPSPLERKIPHRIFGFNPDDGATKTLLEVDTEGRVRGFHPAPVPRQLFWVLTALRRATADRAPLWVLEQFTRALDKFGPDESVYQRLMEEERERDARRRRRMKLRPEMAAAADAEEAAAAAAARAAAVAEAEAEAEAEARAAAEARAEGKRLLFGTGKVGSLLLDGEGQTDANWEGWYAWKFPQRRTTRTVQYMGSQGGLQDDQIRHS